MNWKIVGAIVLSLGDAAEVVIRVIYKLIPLITGLLLINIYEVHLNWFEKISIVIFGLYILFKELNIVDMFKEYRFHITHEKDIKCKWCK